LRSFIFAIAIELLFLTSILLAAQEGSLRLRVFGMGPHGEGDIKSVVSGLPGVFEVRVDALKKELSFKFAPEFITETKIIMALRRAGYDVRRLFPEWKLERVFLGISGIKDDIAEIEKELYAFYDVDRVEIFRNSDMFVAVIDFRKGKLDPGQLIWSLKFNFPDLNVEIIPSLKMHKESKEGIG